MSLLECLKCYYKYNKFLSDGVAANIVTRCRIIGCRDLLVASYRYMKGRVLSYVSHANVMYGIVPFQVYFYVLWKTEF
jgi:hypothetical protein